MTDDKKPREFWLELADDALADADSIYDVKIDEAGIIHVIEVSALVELQAKYREAINALSLARHRVAYDKYSSHAERLITVQNIEQTLASLGESEVGEG